MKINLIKANGALSPSLPEDEEKLSKWKWGDILEVEIKKPRNGGFHRKFMAMVGLVFENQEKYPTIEKLLIEIKLLTGHYTDHTDLDGKTDRIPDSISYAAMDEMEFALFYSKAIDVILANIMPVEREDLDRMVDVVLGFA